MYALSTSASNSTPMNPKQIQLINELKLMKMVRSKEVEEVMKSIDRADFCKDDPHHDSPQLIGYQATISAPHMHAMALEYLKDHLHKGKRSLDVGSGSGYLTLAFAKMMQEPDAKAYGVEHIPQLVTLSIKNINKQHKEFLTSGKVEIHEGDGRLGLPDHAPYDAIHVGAAAEKMPQELLDQLAKGGRMVIPVGKYLQDFMVVDKDMDGNIKQKRAFGVRYVPLTSRVKQLLIDL